MVLRYFGYRAQLLKRIKNYKVWQDGNHAELIYNSKIFYQKLNYVHRNPLKEMIVEYPEEYLFSSARNYADRDYLLEIILESQELKTY